MAISFLLFFVGRNFRRSLKSYRAGKSCERTDCRRGRTQTGAGGFIVHAFETAGMVRNSLCSPAKRLYCSHRNQRCARRHRPQRSGRGSRRSRSRQRLSSRCHTNSDDAVRTLRVSDQSFCDLENSRLTEQTCFAMAAKTGHLKKAGFRASANRPLNCDVNSPNRGMDHSSDGLPRPLIFSLILSAQRELRVFLVAHWRIRLIRQFPRQPLMQSLAKSYR